MIGVFFKGWVCVNNDETLSSLSTSVPVVVPLPTALLPVRASRATSPPSGKLILLDGCDTSRQWCWWYFDMDKGDILWRPLQQLLMPVGKLEVVMELKLGVKYGNLFKFNGKWRGT